MFLSLLYFKTRYIYITFLSKAFPITCSNSFVLVGSWPEIILLALTVKFMLVLNSVIIEKSVLVKKKDIQCLVHLCKKCYNLLTTSINFVK